MSDQPPKRGAVPLDAAVRKVEAAGGASQEKANPNPTNDPDGPDTASEARAETPTPPDQDQVMTQIMAWLYNEAKAGRIKAMSMVMVDDSGVPQHAFVIKDGASMPLLAGAYVAIEALKGGAVKDMMDYRKFLFDKAKHDAEQQRSEPGKGEQANEQPSASKPH